MTSLALALLAVLSAPPPAIDGALPPGASAAVVATFDSSDLPDLSRFDVGPGGQPVLAKKAAFIPLGADAEKAFRIKGLEKIDSFAFAADGALLVVSGRSFGVASAKGLVQLAELPRDGMKVVAAARRQALLFGGNELFRFHAGGKVERLLDSPQPIDAVAADETRLLISTGGAIIDVAGPSPRRLMLAGTPVLSLALAPDGAFFYATASEVGYGTSSARVPFIREKTARVFVRADALFIVGPVVGVLKASPTASFSALLEAAK